MTNRVTLDRVNKFFDRCVIFSGYKVVMYIKSYDNLKKISETFIESIKREPFIENIYSTERFVYISTKSGSVFLMVVINDTIIGEKCHALLVDDEIKDKELREISPKIDVFETEGGTTMLNPKPVYLKID